MTRSFSSPVMPPLHNAQSRRPSWDFTHVVKIGCATLAMQFEMFEWTVNTASYAIPDSSWSARAAFQMYGPDNRHIGCVFAYSFFGEIAGKEELGFGNFAPEETNVSDTKAYMCNCAKRSQLDRICQTLHETYQLCALHMPRPTQPPNHGAQFSFFFF